MQNQFLFYDLLSLLGAYSVLSKKLCMQPRTTKIVTTFHYVLRNHLSKMAVTTDTNVTPIINRNFYFKMAANRDTSDITPLPVLREAWAIIDLTMLLRNLIR